MTARQSGAIKPTTQGTIDWPASNRNAGRNEIGTGGRLRFGINGRLHRNTHLEFGREREGVDLSKVALTHHSLKNDGQRRLDLSGRDETKLAPMTGMGSGSVQEKERVRLAEIIERVNDLFGGDTTDGDQLSYVTTLRDKMLESEALVTQAANNSKAQFDNSPTLRAELMNAIMDALEAHTSLSKQALGSQKVQDGLKDVLLGPAQLYEALRARATEARPEL